MAMTRRERLVLLAARHETLVALAQVQRDTLAQRCGELQTPLLWVERGWRWWAFVRSHVWTVLVPAAAVAVARPRWMAGLATGLVTLSRVSRWFR